MIPRQETLQRCWYFIKNPPTLLFIFCLVTLLELEESVQRAPTIRLLENAICQRYYRDKQVDGPIDEFMCKEDLIQVKLAHIRGWLSLFDSLPLLILGSAFGKIADKRGRRPAFGLAVFGLLCSLGWIYLTCASWKHIPVEVVWVSSLFRIIGGGPAVAISMCLTMVSDLSSEETRSNSFYRVYSAVLVTDLIGPLITYSTLKHSLWLPYLVCALALLLTGPIVLYMPETLLARPVDNEEEAPFDAVGVKKYVRFLKDRRVLVGVITVFLVQFRTNTIEIVLPYTSIRFGLEIGESATLLSLVSAVNLVVFLVILPAASSLMKKRAGWSITTINIFVARISSALLVSGAAILAAASTLGIVILALTVYAAGFGVRLSILAVLTSFVNSARDTGQLYTLVATTDAIAHMIASPLLQSVWSSALQLGGRWIVLPFVVLTGIFFVAFLTSCALREKPVMLGNRQDVDESQEPLLSGENDDAQELGTDDRRV
ncbi:major facilitator superfamily domain-containing protein [Aspergillus spinulosporus]